MIISFSFIACALQTCLSKNTYAQEKCAEHMRTLYECCQALYDATATEARGESTATACPAPSVVQSWLKRNSGSAKRK
ncbi:hypothetical protein F5888DRAFT_499057 [Russula emetica]|nr:hypothetical protein F5888DRAFT_499057 [Russula emetica]